MFGIILTLADSEPPYKISERGKDNMAKYELTKELETGNPIIDSEHRQLLQAVNSLLDACSQGQGSAKMNETVRFLADYVNRHFGHEEQLQQQSKYPGYQAHKTFHDKYKQTLSEIMAAMPKTGVTGADLAKFNQHIGVLIAHIKTEDKKLAAFLSGK